MKMASLVILICPILVLGGTAVAVATAAGRAAIFNPGPHGFSEILYAFSSAGNNNGSAFGGLGVGTPFYQRPPRRSRCSARATGSSCRCSPWPDRLPRKQTHPRRGGHVADPRADSSSSAGRDRPDRRSADIPSRPRAGTDRRGPAGPHVRPEASTMSSRSGKMPARASSENRQAGGARGVPEAGSPRAGAQPGHVRRLGRQPRDHRALSSRRSPARARSRRVRPDGLAVALVHGPLRELRRGGGGGPRSRAGRGVAQGPARSDRAQARPAGTRRADRRSSPRPIFARTTSSSSSAGSSSRQTAR